MKVTAMIPARMQASRFPGKPLAPILGLSMIEHVRRRVALSDAVDSVTVATCNQEIIDEVTSHGGHAVMTRDDHERCTDRIAEASETDDSDIIVIVQGDEPTFMPDILADMVAPLKADPSLRVTNLVSRITDEADLDDVDIVKAMLNQKGDIMAFSRAPVPHRRVASNPPMYRQTGVSAFRRDYLMEFTALPETPLEVTESVDFLRILEHGHQIRAVVTDLHTAGVDREEDVGIVEEMLKNNPDQAALTERVLG